jgi:TonB family protein
MSDVWTTWENQVVNGAFPLRRFLGSSDHSVVFLTEHAALGITDAAIKFVPADPLRAEAQLSRWRVAAALPHPHLVRILDTGRCQLGGHPFLFAVMEYADQTLAQVLTHRPLTPEEVREIMPPTLGALAFLHGRHLVQGQLKPPNFLVINDQLKLAIDTVRPADDSNSPIAKPSSYDAPEARDGVISPAGDIWGLGATLVEALTQRPPPWPHNGIQTITLPASLTPAFADTIRRCLSRDPASRPGIAELEAALNPGPSVSPVSVSRSDAREAPAAVGPAGVQSSPEITRFIVPVIAAGLLALFAWAALHLFTRPHEAPQPIVSTAQPVPQQASPPAPSSQGSNAPVSAPASVLHQEIPDVPRSARDTIRGRIKVTVRVTVDPAGNVVSDTLQYSGSSKYFARLALDAARKWKFVPAENVASREWLLQFEFTSGGTTGHATPGR